jgi:hypothetical protein
MTTEIPLTDKQKWDAIALDVLHANGRYVVIAEGKRDCIEKAKKALARRGLQVDVTSRRGDGSDDRPWSGVRTYARAI